MDNGKFEAFCVVELFGHARIVGRVTEQTIGGGSFIRVDVPETSKEGAFTKFYGPAAIYSITPLPDEETMQRIAEAVAQPPIEAWKLNLPRLAERASMPADQLAMEMDAVDEDELEASDA